MGSLSPDDIRALATCFIFLFACLVAVIMALLAHQRKMTEILRADRLQGQSLDSQVSELQSQIRELKSMLQSQAPNNPSEDISQRIGSL